MTFTAKDVQNLREKTGCGMMDCKKALTASEGNIDKAIEWLREKGLAATAKKASRIAAEGLVLAAVDKEKKLGAIVEVNVETDFVAKNETFISFVDTVAKTVLEENPKDLDALLECKAYGQDLTVADMLREKIFTIGENMKIRRFARFEGDCVSYIHGGGKIGVLVKFDTDVADKEGFEAYGKDIAMQIAAANPGYLDRASVPADVIAEEKSILMAQIANDEKLKNKPEKVIEKMVEGKIGKFYKENCLVDQEFVKNGDLSIAQYTANTAKELGGSIAIVDFVRFEKGEGLEKRSDNFADEVASMIK